MPIKLNSVKKISDSKIKINITTYIYITNNETKIDYNCDLIYKLNKGNTYYQITSKSLLKVLDDISFNIGIRRIFIGIINGGYFSDLTDTTNIRIYFNIRMDKNYYCKWKTRQRDKIINDIIND